MDFKQRFLAAMHHEEPDRVPVMGLIMDPATVNQILHKRPADFPGMLRKPVLRKAVRGLLNSNRYWDRMYYGNFSGALQGAIELVNMSEHAVGQDGAETAPAIRQGIRDGLSQLAIGALRHTAQLS